MEVGRGRAKEDEEAERELNFGPGSVGSLFDSFPKTSLEVSFAFVAPKLPRGGRLYKASAPPLRWQLATRR